MNQSEIFYSVKGIFDTARRALGAGADTDSALLLVSTFNSEANRVFFRVKADERMSLGCDEGCSYCCNLRVTIFEHEAIAIHQFVIKHFSEQEISQVLRSLQANASIIEGLTETEHLGTNIPCAFLKDGRCSIYPVRPSACAGYHSFSSAACRKSDENPTDFDSQLPKLADIERWYQEANGALGAAQEQANRSPERTELNTTVLSVFENPSNQRRWKKRKRLVGK